MIYYLMQKKVCLYDHFKTKDYFIQYSRGKPQRPVFYTVYQKYKNIIQSTYSYDKNVPPLSSAI